MKNTMSKLKELIDASNNVFKYATMCAKYYAGKGMSFREIIDAEHAAMIQFKKDVDASAAS